MPKFYRRAAELGSAEGKYELAQLYRSGLGVEKDPDAHRHWLEMAAQAGYAKAQYALARTHDDTTKAWADPQTGMEWLRRAAAAGYVDAQVDLARRLEKRTSPFFNEEESVRWFLVAAENGSRLAQYCMGSKFRQGQHVERNAGKAIEWFRKAAAQRHAGSALSIAAIYAKGADGVAQNLVEAEVWYRKALDFEKTPKAPRRFADFLVEQERYDEAVSMYHKAVLLSGDQMARACLAKHCQSDKAIPRDVVKAYAWSLLTDERFLPKGFRSKLEVQLTAEQHAAALAQSEDLAQAIRDRTLESWANGDVVGVLRRALPGLIQGTGGLGRILPACPPESNAPRTASTGPSAETITVHGCPAPLSAHGGSSIHTVAALDCRASHTFLVCHESFLAP